MLLSPPYTVTATMNTNGCDVFHRYFRDLCLRLDLRLDLDFFGVFLCFFIMLPYIPGSVQS